MAYQHYYPADSDADFEEASMSVREKKTGRTMKGLEEVRTLETGSICTLFGRMREVEKEQAMMRDE